MKEAAEQQAMNGIAGAPNLKRFAAIKYFGIFEKKIKSAHDAVLAILESCHTWERLAKIPAWVDSRAQRFLAEIDGKVKELGGEAPFSPEIKDIGALYDSLRRDFEFRASVVIRKKRQDFWLKALLIPAALGLLWIVLRKL